MRILILAMTCKTDANSVFISGIVPRSDKLNEKASKVNSILRHEGNKRNICFIDNKHISPRFHCDRSGLHLNYYGTKKLQANFLGLLLYVNENLPGKIINSYKFREISEIVLLEFSVSNKKWLLLGNYRPPSQNDLSFINELNLAWDFLSPKYENFVLLGDLNLSRENPKNFMCSFDLESLIDSPTCHKSINATHIDLILTNSDQLFYEVCHV